jgi:hypothetical protein
MTGKVDFTQPEWKLVLETRRVRQSSSTGPSMMAADRSVVVNDV